MQKICLAIIIYILTSNLFAEWLPANGVVYTPSTNITTTLVYTNIFDSSLYRTNFSLYGDVLYETIVATNLLYSPTVLDSPFVDFLSMLNASIATNAAGTAALKIVVESGTDWARVNSNLTYTTNYVINYIYTNVFTARISTNNSVYGDLLYKTFTDTNFSVRPIEYPYSDTLSSVNGIIYTNAAGQQTVRLAIEGLSDIAFVGSSISNIYLRKDIDDTMYGDLSFAGDNVITNVKDIYINSQLIVNNMSGTYDSIFYDSDGSQLLYVDVSDKKFGIGMIPTGPDQLQVSGPASFYDSVAIFTNLYLINSAFTNTMSTDATGNLIIQ